MDDDVGRLSCPSPQADTIGGGCTQGGVLTQVDPGGEASAASLAATVLEEERPARRQQDRARERVIFPDDLFPGANAEPMTLRQGLRIGGWFMFVILTAIVSLDELEGAAINVLAPEIQHTFHMSEGAIVFIGTASAAFFVLGAVPMGWLADRVKRVPIVGVSSIAVRRLRPGLRLRRQFLHAVLDPLLHRHRQGQHHPRARVAHRRRLPDRRCAARMSAAMQGASHAMGLMSPGPGGGRSPTSPAVPRAGAGPGTCSGSRCRSWPSAPSS